MKTLTTFTLAAIFSTTLAMADSPQLRNHLDLQRQQMNERNVPTIALYGHGRGIGTTRQGTVRRSDTQLEQRFNAHGGRFGVFAPVK